jgi:hypothetical protein
MPTPKELARGLLDFDREKEMLRQLPGLLNAGYEGWKAQPQMAAFGGLLSGDLQPMKEWLGVGQPLPKDAAEQVKRGAYNLAMDWNNPMGMAGTFIGKGAKTWDAVKASEAEKLLASGADPRNVWKNTGTFKGVDGHLRQEIDDSVVPSKMLLTEKALFKYPPVSQAYPHKELYKAYPETADLRLAPEFGRYSGSFDSTQKTIGIKPIQEGSITNPAESMTRKSTALHEMQHAIQEKEGWATGGNVEQFKIAPESMQNLHSLDDMMQAELLINRAQESGMSISDFAKNPPRWANDNSIAIAKLFETRPKDFKSAMDYVIGARDPHEAYRRLAGEAEARLTQSRMNMTMPERLNSYPYDMLDVPQDQLIIRGLLGGQ